LTLYIGYSIILLVNGGFRLEQGGSMFFLPVFLWRHKHKFLAVLVLGLALYGLNSLRSTWQFRLLGLGPAKVQKPTVKERAHDMKEWAEGKKEDFTNYLVKRKEAKLAKKAALATQPVMEPTTKPERFKRTKVFVKNTREKIADKLRKEPTTKPSTD
jgi:hypothetical protein